MRTGGVALLVAGVAALALVGCGGRQSTGASSGTVVPALVLHFEDRGVAVFVKVTLERHPYYFLVDSGASGTIVDARVARTLGLQDRGRPQEAFTASCGVAVQPVELPAWRLGNRVFGATTIYSQRTVFPGAGFGFPLAGLLGSDLLSRFGTITLDFAHGRLILGGSLPQGGRAIPIKVARHDGDVVAIVRATIHGKATELVLDTGAGSPLIDSRAAARLGLSAAGRSVTGTGAACRVTATPLSIGDWAIGGVPLPKTYGAATRLVRGKATSKVVGVIGTDALSQFGELTIDYAHSRMILGGTVH